MRTLLAVLLGLAVAGPSGAIERGHGRQHRHERYRRHREYRQLHHHGKRICWRHHPRRGTMLVAHGSYTGDGTGGLKITKADNGPIGFKASVLVIAPRTDTDLRVLWIDTMDPGFAIGENNAASRLLAANLQSVEVDGFTLGPQDPVNASGVEYVWLMLGKDTSRGGRDLVTGTYTGDGNDDRAIPIGFSNPSVSPLAVVTVQEDASGNGEPAWVRDSAHSGDASSDFLDDGGELTDRIQSFAADSFEVGAANQVNQSGYTYHFFAIADDDKDNSISVVSWVGDGTVATDTQDVTGAAVAPTAAWMADVGSVSNPNWLALAAGPTPDTALSAGHGGYTTAVSSWNADGITVIGHTESNQLNHTYHAWLFSTVGQSASGRLSTPMREALQNDPAAAVWLLDVVFPDETRLYSTQGVASESEGQYEAKILSISDISSEISDTKGGQLGAMEVKVHIADNDHELAHLFKGSYADQIDLDPPTARIRCAAPGVDPGDWKTEFTGEMLSWNAPGSYVIELVLRTPDRLLRREFPDSALILSRSDFPLAPDDTITRVAPLLYGNHLSVEHTTRGFVPLLLVDPAEPKFLVCAHAAKEITAVYVDEIETFETWSTSIETINGKDYTFVAFSTFTGDPTEAKVTADVRGYEEDGDGSGTLITNPATELSHLLSNFIYAVSLTGSWEATHSIVDAEHFATAEDFLEARGYSGSRRISVPTRGLDLLAEWATSHEARVWWTPEGAIAVGFEDPAAELEYGGVVWIREQDVLDEPSLDNDDTRIVTRLSAGNVRDESQGSYVYSLNVSVPYRDEIPESRDYPWSDAG